MSIGLRMDLRQTQQLVMTPQLQQAIRMLAMSNAEVTEFVEQEVEKNPLLVLDDGDGSADADPAKMEPAPALLATDRATLEGQRSYQFLAIRWIEEGDRA